MNTLIDAFENVQDSRSLISAIATAKDGDTIAFLYLMVEQFLYLQIQVALLDLLRK